MLNECHEWINTGKNDTSKGEGKKRRGRIKRIKWSTDDRDALYLSNLTSSISKASFKDFSITLIFQGRSLASILHLETPRLKKREKSFPEYI